MENEEKMMTGEESLRIISQMINKTKVNIQQGSFHLLFWGWLILACSLSEYILMNFVGYSQHYYVWFLTIPGGFVSMIYGIVSFADPSLAPLGMSVAVTAGYLIPGYMLKYKGSHDKV